MRSEIMKDGRIRFGFTIPQRATLFGVAGWPELLELARKEAILLAENPERAAEVIKQLEAISPSWRKRYQLASVG